MTKRILLVDDQEDALVLMRGALKNVVANEEVVSVQSGDEALELLHGQDPLTPDLVFLDIRMPRINGLEVLQRIRDEQSTRELNVVIVSSSTYEGDIEQARALGAEYLVKPMEVAQLRRKLTEYVHRYLDT